MDFEGLLRGTKPDETKASSDLSREELASQINLLTARITGNLWKMVALIGE
ncbi:hypothetical protein [Bremerella sp. P1]|uniref:hypothetical protein n=1 Tax=Bremerella sp. P1 TaxID=3026424 RepID=UPI002368B7A5|nr:hypothetical protein [Bremerella sp. P1]WDI44792.1 hypothetical protein PSR63_12685 [Bremerella sp. P1]